MTGWDAAPTGLLRLGPDGTITAANPTVLAWTGRDVVEGLRLSDLLSVGGRIYWETHLAPLLHVEGRLDEVALELRAAQGRRPVLLTAATDVGGDVLVVLSGAAERSRFERELVASRASAEQSAARLRALQDATARLSGAVGVDAVASALLDAAVGPLGGSAATLWLTDSAQDLVPRGARGEPAALPVSGVALRGRTAVSVEGRAVVPLHGSTALRGVLSLAERTDAGADPLDLELLTALGQQAGTALDRAHLHEQSASVARELQHSLLAVAPPEDHRFAVATVYRPGVEALEVGGDWYDVFLGEEGVLSLVVGDVVGRGLAAASAMGQLRSAVRAVAGPGVGPARLLERLDRFVDQVEAAGMATLAYAELSLATGRLRYACAGHPPPLLLPADGPPRLLWEGRSTPLGAFVHPASRDEAEVQLAPGDRLLLCTDGLFERRDRSLDDGLARLVEAARDTVDTDLGEAVRSLTSRLLEDEVTRDDVCVLLLSWSGGSFERHLTADLVDLSQVRQDLATWLSQRSTSTDVVEDLVLAASEALANAAEHGSGRSPTQSVSVCVHVERRPAGRQEVVLQVRDRGRWRTPTASIERGRGLRIIGALVDSVVVEGGDGTTVVMRRELGEAS